MASRLWTTWHGLVVTIRSVPTMVSAEAKTCRYSGRCRQVNLKAYGKEIVTRRTGKPGRPKAPYCEPSPELKCATVHKPGEKGTDRGRNGRKTRKTYRFSKDWDMHDAVTYFTMYTV